MIARAAFSIPPPLQIFWSLPNLLQLHRPPIDEPCRAVVTDVQVTPNDRVLCPWVVELNFHKSFHLPMFDKVLDLRKEKKREGYESLLVSLAYLFSYAAVYGLHLNHMWGTV